MKAYRWLLRAYPPAFRRKYGAEMEATFALILADARTRAGRFGAARAWVRAAADITTHATAEHRAARHRSGGSSVLESLATDFRQAARSLRSRPALTIPAILTIALSIGATAGIFGIVNAMLFRPLPYAEPDRLVLLWERFAPMDLDTMPWSIADYRAVEEGATQLSDTAIFRGDRVARLDGSAPTRLVVISASANLFDLLGVAPMLGRGYDANAGAREVVLGYSVWRDEFGADPHVIGRSVSLDTGPAVVVGVMPEHFQFPPPITFSGQMLTRDPDVYMAFDLERNGEGNHSHFAVARLADEATFESALAELSSIAAAVIAANPEAGLNTRDFGMHALPLHGQSVTTVRQALLLILSAVAAVLLIACASVANLLLARAMARRQEMALRAAIGASRWRLVRQLLVESLLLGILGGAGGLLVAPWISQGLLAVSPIAIQEIMDVRVDGTVLAFAALTTLTAVLAFGLIPALQGSRLDLISVMRSGTRVSATRSELRTKSVLVIGQVSIAMVLMVAAGLAAQSLGQLWAVDPGFKPDNVEAFSTDLPASRYPDDTSRLAYQRQLLDSLNGVHGVTHASIATTLPFTFDRSWSNYIVEGEPPRRPGDFLIANRNIASPDYFSALGIPLIYGRPFNDRDTAQAPPVVIVSRTVAERHWPGVDPTGRRVAYDPPDDREPTWMTVVAVADDVLMNGFDDTPEALFYLPSTQSVVESFWVTYRTTREGVSRDARAAAAALDNALPLGTVRTLGGLMGETVKKPRFTAVLLSAFGVTALFIAAVGLYGVLAFDVTRQTRDIGVRLALGATPGHVQHDVLLRGLGLSGIGLAVGGIAAYLVARAMEDLLFGVSSSDVLTFVGTGVVLVLVAAIASWLPARRATRVDPMIALRSE